VHQTKSARLNFPTKLTPVSGATNASFATFATSLYNHNKPIYHKMPTENNPIPIRIAQVLGITTSALLAGNTLSLSFFTISRLLESPTPLMLRQWKSMFLAEKVVSPPAATLAALSYFYLSYKSHVSSSSPFVSNSASISYAVAGLLSTGVIAYTFGIQTPTNIKLLKKADETSALEKSGTVVEVGLGEETAHKLVDNWGLLNLGRGVMLTASAVLGAWTAL
jgi:hypothetical protein